MPTDDEPPESTPAPSLIRLHQEPNFASLVAQSIASASGRTALAQAMGVALIRGRETQELARQILPVQQLPPGASLIYDEAGDVVGASVSESVPARRLVFPQFEIFSNPTIPLSNIRERRFGYGDIDINRPFTTGTLRGLSGLQVATPAWIQRGLWIAHREDPSLFGQVVDTTAHSVTISLWKREIEYLDVRGSNLLLLIEADAPFFPTRFEREYLL